MRVLAPSTKHCWSLLEPAGHRRNQRSNAVAGCRAEYLMLTSHAALLTHAAASDPHLTAANGTNGNAPMTHCSGLQGLILVEWRWVVLLLVNEQNERPTPPHPYREATTIKCYMRKPGKQATNIDNLIWPGDRRWDGPRYFRSMFLFGSTAGCGWFPDCWLVHRFRVMVLQAIKLGTPMCRRNLELSSCCSTRSLIY
ncbi:hypothetical protein F5B20DRAFT_395979 [Whalleya microplaca]|nr:hypothetical protein F5B20DRAFT_395979 [Whalleya microplaca]